MNYVARVPLLILIIPHMMNYYTRMVDWLFLRSMTWFNKYYMNFTLLHLEDNRVLQEPCLGLLPNFNGRVCIKTYLILLSNASFVNKLSLPIHYLQGCYILYQFQNKYGRILQWISSQDYLMLVVLH